MDLITDKNASITFCTYSTRTLWTIYAAAVITLLCSLVLTVIYAPSSLVKETHYGWSCENICNSKLICCDVNATDTPELWRLSILADFPFAHHFALSAQFVKLPNSIADQGIFPALTSYNSSIPKFLQYSNWDEDKILKACRKEGVNCYKVLYDITVLEEYDDKTLTNTSKPFKATYSLTRPIICPAAEDQDAPILCNSLYIINGLPEGTHSSKYFTVVFDLSNRIKELFWMGNVAFNISYVNADFIAFENAVRCIALIINGIALFYFSKKAQTLQKSASLKSEQRWIFSMLVALILYNDPFFTMNLIINKEFLYIFGHAGRVLFLIVLVEFFVSSYIRYWRLEPKSLVWTVIVWICFVNILLSSFVCIPTIYASYYQTPLLNLGYDTSHLYPFQSWFIGSFLLYELMVYFAYVEGHKHDQTKSWKLDSCQMQYTVALGVHLLALVFIIMQALFLLQLSAAQFIFFQVLFNIYILVLAYLLVTSKGSDFPYSKFVTEDIYSEHDEQKLTLHALFGRDSLEKDDLEVLWEELEASQMLDSDEADEADVEFDAVRIKNQLPLKTF